MLDKLIRNYKEIGIDLKDGKHPLSKEFDLYEKEINESIKKDIEFFLIDFVVAMRTFQKTDKNSFNYYQKRIKENSNLNFWGEYFEAILHFKFIEKAKRIGFDIRRGIIKKGEPDLVIFNENESFNIEITTLKYTDKSNKSNPENKIIERIIEKNNKSYANNNCILIINISNLLYNEMLGITSFNKPLLNIFKEMESIVKFNRIMLFETFFSKVPNSLYYKIKTDVYKYNQGLKVVC